MTGSQAPRYRRTSTPAQKPAYGRERVLSSSGTEAGPHMNKSDRERILATCPLGCGKARHPDTRCDGTRIDWAARKAKARAWRPGAGGLKNPDYEVER